MGTLKVSLFGKFLVQVDQQPLKLENYKVQELLSYLLLHRGRPHYRETLANLLWTDAAVVRSKRYLRKSLWQLQAALNQQEGLLEGLLLVEPDWIQLNSDTDLWLDVMLFEQAFKHSQGQSGRQLESSCIQELKLAIDLYKGDLLEGWFEDWCLFERERLQQMYLIMLDKLVDYCEVHGEYENGLLYGTRILGHDHARERTHRCLMRLYYLAGDRTEALRQYQRCREMLKKELDVQPAERTEALYRQIQADRLELPAPTSPRHPLTPTTSLMIEALDHLKKLEEDLCYTQGQVRHKIEMIEMLLADPRQ